MNDATTYLQLLGQEDMSNYQHQPDRGSLFVNQSKDKINQPDYTGSYATADGEVRRMAAWVNKTKSNTEYISIIFQDDIKQKPDDNVSWPAKNNALRRQ